MKKMILSFEEFLLEKSKTYDYGCSMLYFDFPQMTLIDDNIEERDVFKIEDSQFDLEKKSNYTLLYGIHSDEVSDDEVIRKSKFYSRDPLILKNISIFKNKDYEVLKFDVEHGDLMGINKSLRELPHTTDFPDYHPHCTVAYLKPGTSEKYLKAYEGRSFQVHPKHVVYSKPDGSKMKVSPR